MEGESRRLVLHPFVADDVRKVSTAVFASEVKNAARAQGKPRAQAEMGNIQGIWEELRYVDRRIDHIARLNYLIY